MNGIGSPGMFPPGSVKVTKLAPTPWPDPDASVLKLHRRPPPKLPLEVFGGWAPWITEGARAAACPVDYVAIPLLSAASVLIGHARWSQASAAWAEPPHLWTGVVGDSGDGKSPGADALNRDVLPVIENRMRADFPRRLREWTTKAEEHHAKVEAWKREVRAATKAGNAPPEAPADFTEPEPQSPGLRQYDITHERIEELLAFGAPKGLLIMRDELGGWVDGMNAYNEAGRTFWIESYGGRSYTVDRKKFKMPLVIARLAVGVCGGTQPDKVARLIDDGDDGLLARFLWSWPDPIEFRLGTVTPNAQWAVTALDRLRCLELEENLTGEPCPVMVPLAVDARLLMNRFGGEMQQKQKLAGGLLRSAYGKARGQALRLALNLEFLWWCAQDEPRSPPASTSKRAFAAATMLMADYFMPMAERVYGDASLTRQDRNAATLARWIMRDQPQEVHVRHVQREVRLPGLISAELIENAAEVLIEAEWLREPVSKKGFGEGRGRNAYPVNPKLFEKTDEGGR